MDNIPSFEEDEIIRIEFAKELAEMATYVACTYPGKTTRVKLHVNYSACDKTYFVSDRDDGTIYVECGLNYLRLYPYGEDTPIHPF